MATTAGVGCDWDGKCRGTGDFLTGTGETDRTRRRADGLAACEGCQNAKERDGRDAGRDAVGDGRLSPRFTG